MPPSPPGKILWAVLVLVALTLSLALSQALRDTTPPDLFVVAPERIAAGEPFEVMLTASEPVVYQVSYADTAVEHVTQDLVLDLLGREGRATLSVRATDGADNHRVYTQQILGVAPLELVTEAPETLQPGEPFSFQAQWTPAGVPPASVTMTLDGRPLELVRSGNRGLALAGVPLGSEPGTRALEVRLTDEFGREIEAVRTLEVLPDPRPVQQLTIAPSVLASSTPQNKALEAQVLDAAFGGSAHPSTPLWLEPFTLPIEGLGTSGFGTPRRYVVGGRVSYHLGADIAAPAGTPIHATNRGVVVVADFYPIKGGLVVIDHGAGVFSLYFHQSKILVEAGDEVERGVVVGEVGSTGLSTGPHLHWEMRLGDTPTNPMSWVGKVWP